MSIRVNSSTAESLYLSMCQAQAMQIVNLRDDPQCKLGIEIILRRYQDADFLNESSREALELNPVVMRKYENGEYINK